MILQALRQYKMALHLLMPSIQLNIAIQTMKLKPHGLPLTFLSSADTVPFAAERFAQMDTRSIYPSSVDLTHS